MGLLNINPTQNLRHRPFLAMEAAIRRDKEVYIFAIGPTCVHVLLGRC